MNIKDLELKPEEINQALFDKLDAPDEDLPTAYEVIAEAQIQHIQDETNRTGKVIAFVPEGFEWKLPENPHSTDVHLAAGVYDGLYHREYNTTQQDLLNSMKEQMEVAE